MLGMLKHLNKFVFGKHKRNTSNYHLHIHSNEDVFNEEENTILSTLSQIELIDNVAS